MFRPETGQSSARCSNEEDGMPDDAKVATTAGSAIVVGQISDMFAVRFANTSGESLTPASSLRIGGCVGI